MLPSLKKYELTIKATVLKNCDSSFYKMAKIWLKFEERYIINTDKTCGRSVNKISKLFFN